MADTKISALSAGTAAPGDEIPVNRGGSNFKITAGDILKINGGTITADSPVLNLTQTWNNAAVTFTGLKFNADGSSSTNSASASLLMDLQVGGSSKFKVDKSGGVVVPSAVAIKSDGANATKLTLTDGFGAGTGLSLAGYNQTSAVLNVYMEPNGEWTSRLRSAASLSWTDNSGNAASGSRDLILARDAAGTLAQRNAANAQTFRIYNNYTDATNTFERGKIAWESDVLRIGTEKGVLGGSARALELQTDGTTRLTISAAGATEFSGQLVTQTTGSASAPVLAFSGDLDTGIFRRVANAVSFSSGNLESLIISSTGTFLPSTLVYGFNSGALGLGGTSIDTAIARSAAAVVKVTDGSTGNGAIQFAHGEAKEAYTVATLPGTPAVGMIARVTDASAPAVGSTVSGGGAAAALCWYNGANWTVIGV